MLVGFVSLLIPIIEHVVKNLHIKKIVHIVLGSLGIYLILLFVIWAILFGLNMSELIGNPKEQLKQIIENIKNNMIGELGTIASVVVSLVLGIVLLGHFTKLREGSIHHQERLANLSLHLKKGGLLIINDDYGLRPYVEPYLSKLIPEAKLDNPLPLDHPLFTSFFDFPQGIPKIHKHDDKPPRVYGIYYRKRPVILFMEEADIVDGWEPGNPHNDPPESLEKAFQFGVNLLYFALSN